MACIAADMATEHAAARTPAGSCAGAAALTLLAAGAACAPAAAQELRIRPEVEASVTVTSNAAYATASQARTDAIMNVNPRLALTSRGGRVSVDGTFGVEAVAYANNSDASMIRPRGRVDVRSELIERWAYFDASVVADRVSANPYAARPESSTAFNDYTSMRYRLTPYLQRQLTPRLSLLARTDHVLTQRVGGTSAFDPGGTDPARDAHEQAQRLQIDLLPMPFGATLELTREDTRHRGATSSILNQNGVRAIATYSPAPQLTVGAIAGREVSRYSLFERTDPITGADLKWQPSERSTLEARLEKRFFGTGVALAWRHRTPFFGFNISADRRPVAQSGSHLLGFAGADVATLLDGVLTTRFPDEGQRGELVDKLIRDLNLPTTLTAPLDLYTSYAQLQDGASATVLFFGRLTTFSATAFARRRVRLVNVEDVLAPTALTSDNRQLGLELVLNRRLSPTVSADAGLRATKIQGLGARQGDSSTDVFAQAGLAFLTSPTTRLGIGARHQIVKSTVTNTSRETALVATLLHRF